MKPSYQIVDRKDSQSFAKYLAQNGQLLLPLVELIEASRLAVDELIDVLGRASIEAVLQLSAAGVAGEKHQGRQGGDFGWHGTQEGKASLSDRKLRVKRPRLRRKGQGPGREVEIPAYETMKSGLGSRLLEILTHMSPPAPALRLLSIKALSSGRAGKIYHDPFMLKKRNVLTQNGPKKGQVHGLSF